MRPRGECVNHLTWVQGCGCQLAALSFQRVRPRLRPPIIPHITTLSQWFWIWKGGVCYLCSALSSSISSLCVVNRLRDRSWSQASQPLHGESDFRDSSGPLFSMYLKIGEEEDDKTVGRWQGDAKGILFFVSPCIVIHTCTSMTWNVIDRFIFSRCCHSAFSDSPRPQARLSGHLSIPSQ